MTYKNILFLVLLALTVPAAATALSIDYTYDAAGRLTKEVYSNGTVVDYTYDAAGNKTGHTVTLPTTTVSPTSSTTTTANPASSTTTTASGSSSTSTSAGATTTTLAGPATTTTTTGGPCPAKQVLGADNPKLENLRDFRDSRLAQSSIGRRVIQIYYTNAGSINAALERSPALRTAAQRILEAIAPMVGNKQ